MTIEGALKRLKNILSSQEVEEVVRDEEKEGEQVGEKESSSVSVNIGVLKKGIRNSIFLKQSYSIIEVMKSTQ